MNKLRVAMHDEYSVVCLGTRESCSESYFVPNKYSYQEGLDWFGDHPTAAIMYARRVLEDFFRSEDPTDWDGYLSIRVANINEKDGEETWDVVNFNVEPEFYTRLTEGRADYMDCVDDFGYEVKTFFD